MEKSSFDDYRLKSTHHDVRDATPLDIDRAKLSLQHVRALNTQFASWVQSHLQNHLDELWIDGVKDYLAHALKTLDEFKDVVDWLKETAAKSQGEFSASLPKLCNSVSVSKDAQSNPGPVAAVASSPVIGPTKVSLPETSSLPFSSQILSSPKIRNNISKDAIPANLPLMQSPQLNSSQTGCFFSTSLTSSPIFPGSKNSSQQTMENSGATEEDELEQPSSPSLKKVEEKGVSIVHEVKCKVYIKDNLAESHWKDMGPANLSIKSKEGTEKASKESKPTIICRNDAGKILLNALIYPGIKMNIQKTSIVSIFHTTAGEDHISSQVVARPYLLRLKSLEETTKLAETIRQWAPST